MDIVSKNYYLFGCLVILVPFGLIDTYVLFGGSIKYFLRGISPWTFFISFLIAAVFILALAMYIDSQTDTKDTLSNSMIKVLMLFTLGSFLLYFVTHAGISFDQKTSFVQNMMRGLKLLFLFLIACSPIVVAMNYIYYKILR